MRITEQMFTENKKSLEVKGIEINKLSLGDMLKAKVIALNDNVVTLSLLDGSQVNAKVINSSSFMLGDILDLLVKEKYDNTVFLSLENNKSFKKEGVSLTKIEDILNKQNLTLSKENIENAQILIKNNLTVNKENMDVFSKVINAFFEGMNNKNMNLNDSKPNHKIIIKENIGFLLKSSVQVKDEDIIAINNIRSNRNLLSENLEKLSNIILNKMNDESKYNIVKSFEYENNIMKQKNEIYNNINPNLKNEIDGLIKDAVSIMSQDNNMTIKSVHDFEDSILRFLSKTYNLEKSDMDMNKLMHGLGEKIKGLDFNSLLFKEYFEAILNKFSVISEEIDNKFNNLLNDKYAIDKKLSNLIKQFNIDYNLSKESLNKLHKDIFNFLEILNNRAELIGQNSITEFKQIIDQTENHLKFLNNTNQNYTYVQVPIMLNESKKNLELFIMKNKNKKIDPHDATLFMSLDTINMGCLETFIELKNKKISVNFRVENQGVQDFIRRNYSLLTQIFDNIGYKLVEMKCKIINDRTNILNATEQITKEFFKNESYIDYKV